MFIRHKSLDKSSAGLFGSGELYLPVLITSSVKWKRLTGWSLRSFTLWTFGIKKEKSPQFLLNIPKFDFFAKWLTANENWKGINHLLSDSFSTLTTSVLPGNFFWLCYTYVRYICLWLKSHCGLELCSRSFHACLCFPAGLSF